MKYKKIFLLVFLLALFVVQQTRASAGTFQGDPVISPLARSLKPELPLSQPATVNVTYYRLNSDGSLKLEQGVPTPCSLKSVVNGTQYFDDSYGCTQYHDQGLDYAYPYSANPYDIPVETDYLLDVLSHEMDPHLFYDSANPIAGLSAEQAQAVAARSFAYNKDPLTNFGDPGSYTQLKASQVDIPFAFEAYINNPLTQPLIPDNLDSPCSSTNLQPREKYVCDAVTSTHGDYLSKGGSAIDAEFSSDMFSNSGNGGPTYLIRVEEPISTTCGAQNFGNLWGMSQMGAQRWSKGNQCATGGSDSTAWPVHF